jgi:hypothetical protein
MTNSGERVNLAFSRDGEIRKDCQIAVISALDSTIQNDEFHLFTATFDLSPSHNFLFREAFHSP